MQLRNARVCLDCEEVHAAQQCPACASETFAFISRWVPAPERRTRPRPTTSPEAEVYRHLTSAEEAPSRTLQRLKQGAVGLTAVGILGWLWSTREHHTAGEPEQRRRETSRNADSDGSE
jgi:hypothetical protein